MDDDGLYPPIEPYRTHRLAVEPPHALHVEECGNPAGLPALFLHGGPGAGIRASQRRTFDPRAFRVVLFDQRGCGRSTPLAELAGNTTQALIADIEAIRAHLGIERWLVAGGSWGSCLALAYGIAHPERCIGFRLHGIFLGSAEEARAWFHGIGQLFPEHWEAFAGHVPEEERDDLLGAYHRRLVDPDPAVHMPAALALRTFSASTQTFKPEPAHVAALTEPRAALAIARLFTHYLVNGAFLPAGHLLNGVRRLRHLPAEIVQGRYDVVTPMAAAWRLKQAWPEAGLTVVDEANHAATRGAPALGRALREATDRLRDRLRADGEPPPPPAAYVRQRAAANPTVSADGATLAWIGDDEGLPQLWAADLGGGPRRRLSKGDERVTAAAFGPVGGDLVFAMDRGGDERHQLYLRRNGADEPDLLTVDPRVVHVWGAFDPSARRIAYASNARDARHLDVHVMDLATRDSRPVLEGEGWRQPLAFAPDGASLLVQDARRGPYDHDLLAVDLATGARQPLLPGGGPARYLAPRWKKDGSGCFLITDRAASSMASLSTTSPLARSVGLRRPTPTSRPSRSATANAGWPTSSTEAASAPSSCVISTPAPSARSPATRPAASPASPSWPAATGWFSR